MGKKETDKRYRETHREQLRQYQAEYYRKNFEKIAKRKHDKAVRDHKIMTPEERAERHRKAIARSKEQCKLWWKRLREDPVKLAEHNKIANAKKREKYNNDPEYRERIRKYNRDRYHKKKMEEQ